MLCVIKSVIKNFGVDCCGVTFVESITLLQRRCNGRLDFGNKVLCDAQRSRYVFVEKYLLSL